MQIILVEAIFKLLVFNANIRHNRGYADAHGGHPLRGKTNMFPKQCAAPGGRAPAKENSLLATGASF